MTTQENQSSGFVIFLRGVVRLILILLIGTIIGGLLYYLGTYLYQQAVLPTQQNTMALNNLNSRVENQWGLLNNSSTALEKRISEIEDQQQITSNSFDEIELLLSDLEDELVAIKSQQTEIIDRLEGAEKSISMIEKQQAAIIKDQESLQSTLETQNNDQKLQPLLLEIQTIKVLQHINRSRLFLIQNNYGLAKTDLQQGLYLLSTMIKTASKEQQDIILMWSARLDLAISHLPDNPVLAGEDLEIIWSLMSNGFTSFQPDNPIVDQAGTSNQDSGTPQVTITLTPASTLTTTPTPTTTQ